MLKPLQIAVGIIRNQQRDIFITQRMPGSQLAGYWEFPGGKVEAGETPEAALYRELWEETGIKVEQATLIEVIEHQLANRQLTLYFYLVEQWQGEPFGREGQPMRWIPQNRLDESEFPPANAPIVRLLLASCE